MSVFTRKEFFAQKERLKTESFVVPGLDPKKEVRIREWSAVEKNEWNIRMYALSKGEKGFKAEEHPEESMEANDLVVLLSMVDGNNQRLFTIDDLPAIREILGDALDYIFERAKKISGLGSDAVEEEAKNLEATAGSDSNSDSPGTSESQTPSRCSKG